MMPRIVRLDDHLTRFGPSSGASGNLCEQLEGALARPEIREVESKVRKQHPNERDFRKVVSLGDQLGANHEVHLVLPDALVHPGKRVLAVQGVAVHAQNSGIRQA